MADGAPHAVACGTDSIHADVEGIVRAGRVG
jgi:hypothetical protein